MKEEITNKGVSRRNFLAGAALAGALQPQALVLLVVPRQATSGGDA